MAQWVKVLASKPHEWNSRGGRREATPKSCLLTPSTHTVESTHQHHTVNKQINR